MFGKKKQYVRDINAHERKWCELQRQEWDARMKMDKLFREIKNSQDAMECFPIGSVDREAEGGHLTSLRHSMLCVCGTFDTIRNELRALYRDHRDEMIDWHCLNGLYEPKGNCHDVLRGIADSFRKYH